MILSQYEDLNETQCVMHSVIPQILAFRMSYQPSALVENERRYGSSKCEHPRTAAEAAKIRKPLPAPANFSVQNVNRNVVALAKLYLPANFHVI